MGICFVGGESGCLVDNRLSVEDESRIEPHTSLLKGKRIGRREWVVPITYLLYGCTYWACVGKAALAALVRAHILLARRKQLVGKSHDLISRDPQ